MAVRLLLVLLFAVYLPELVSCCNRQAFMNCHDGRYEGPIRNVIDNGPTSMAQASDDHGEYLASIVEPIFTSVIGEAIPFSGLVFGVIESIRAAIEGPTEDPYSALISALYEEVQRLKDYVDAKIELLALNDLDNDLGSEHAGIFGRVQDTKEAETTEELWEELEQLQGLLQDRHDHFVPSTDDIISYERSLPFFRVFGDLFMSCLLDQIQAAKELGYTSDIADIAEEIQTRAGIFFRHYIEALGAIVDSHTDLEEPECTVDSYLVSTGWWIFTTVTRVGDFKCTVEMGGETCSIETTRCTDANEENNLKEMIMDKMDTFKENRRSDLQNYWLEQVGYVVYKWNYIATAVKNQVAKLM